MPNCTRMTSSGSYLCVREPVSTSTQCVVRFVGHPDRPCNQDYLEEWGRTVARWLRKGRDVTFFAHCPREEESPHLARDFQRVLEAQGAPVDPLPWDSVRTGAIQPGLFDG